MNERSPAASPAVVKESNVWLYTASTPTNIGFVLPEDRPTWSRPGLMSSMYIIYSETDPDITNYSLNLARVYTPCDLGLFGYVLICLLVYLFILSRPLVCC